MRKASLWYVVIHGRRGTFWAHPHTLSDKRSAVYLRDRLRNSADDARLRYFGSVAIDDNGMPSAAKPARRKAGG